MSLYFKLRKISHWYIPPIGGFYLLSDIMKLITNNNHHKDTIPKPCVTHLTSTLLVPIRASQHYLKGPVDFISKTIPEGLERWLSR